MKLLRVLTGHHAGTQLELVPGSYTISALDTADIQLIDWNAEPATLTLSEDNVATIALETMSGTTELLGSVQRMPDLVAQRFADVVLCLGPLDVLWPKDMSLLTGLILPQMSPPGPGTLRRVLSWPLLLAVAIGVGGGLVVLLSGGAAAAPEQNLSPTMSVAALEVQVTRVLTTFPSSMLVVLRQDQNVVVRGLLNTADEAMQLRERLAIFPRGRVQYAFSSASDVAQSIADGLGIRGIRVIHKGAGVFTLSGQVQSLSHLRDMAAQIQRDLAPLVTELEIEATVLPTAGSKPLSAVMLDDRIQYVQTRDGIKHITVTQTTHLADSKATNQTTAGKP